MKQKEKGFLLLTSHLGDPNSKPLTVAQFRTLIHRVRTMEKPSRSRNLQAEDLYALGYGVEFAHHILHLLDRQEQLEYYVNRGEKWGCYPISRIGDSYPGILRDSLGEDCPGCLWAKGDSALLTQPAVALVGSRELLSDNEEFAREVGKQAAQQGYVLISGNARGADRAAQDSCLEHGGRVISIVADSLQSRESIPGALYLSEDDWDSRFTVPRALSRNRLIHAMGKMTLVARCGLGKGGTWSGTVKNLQHRWSPVFCFRDGSEAVKALVEMGAQEVELSDLQDLSALQKQETSFLE